ncbi:MAG: ribosome-associated translation inhibitor RaiA [Prolixibacteraceae bacterium]|jgi:ribosomal subunit interface protein|nr:ribosome-associated translation inhibitor RaiA [Prolixibacteraceae bacterium]MDI9564874.1 ribosome-associated translation inhibitor RaiA [Bacteroidota bacterium]NLT00865.1 ribosome-associated translation inhibitor RaiA [Bacteroidales bacterium]OQB79423.1 MAG: ribosome hibernation promoting factor HPF [Bacteroidetes bacterium ADurb.Bin123]HNU77099.1 ribosome-associated translation inhibitor RaiA [Prolixibacteraceae bacterium]
MNIKVNSVHFTADQKLIDFVNKKVSKMDTFFEGIIGAEVSLKVEKPETVNNKISEIRISLPSAENLFARKQADTFEEATDLAVEAIRRQLKRHKDKLRTK